MGSRGWLATAKGAAIDVVLREKEAEEPVQMLVPTKNTLVSNRLVRVNVRSLGWLGFVRRAAIGAENE